MTQGIQVPYKELGTRDGSSPNEACDLLMPSATRIIGLDWGDRIDAEWQAIGTASLDDNCELTRHLPERHPEKCHLWVTKVRRTYGVGWKAYHLLGDCMSGGGVEFDSGTGSAPSQGSGESYPGHRSINVFEKAVMELEYTVPPYTLLDDEDPELLDDNGGRREVLRYVEYLPQFQGDYLSVPYSATSLQFTEFNGSKKNYFAGNVGVIVPAELVRLKWWQIPADAVNEAEIYEVVGTVNQCPFFDGRYTYAREHLLFVGLERERIWLPHDGSPGWNITFMFKWFPYGHNHFYDFKCPDPDWRLAALHSSGSGSDSCNTLMDIEITCDDPADDATVPGGTLYDYGNHNRIFSINDASCGSGSGG